MSSRRAVPHEEARWFGASSVPASSSQQEQEQQQQRSTLAEGRTSFLFKPVTSPADRPPLWRGDWQVDGIGGRDIQQRA